MYLIVFHVLATFYFARENGNLTAKMTRLKSGIQNKSKFCIKQENVLFILALFDVFGAHLDE